MNVSARSYLTAGVAAVGAGAMVLAPVQPIPDKLALAPEKAVSNLAVDLAASVNPFAAWVAAAEDTWASVQGLHASWWSQHTEDWTPPFPIFNSFLANQYVYVNELPDIGLIASQFFGNIQKFVKSGFTPGPPTITPPPPSNGNVSPVVTGGLLLPSHVNLYLTLSAIPQFADFLPIIDLATTPISGALLGFAGPGLSAMIQLGESLQEMFTAPTFEGKLQAFFDLAPKVINAGLNGGKFIDLLPIVEALVPDLPPGVVEKLGITTGGVLTAFPYTEPAPGGYQAGGVAFDSIDTKIKVLFTTEDLPGIPIGLIGAIQSMLTFAARDIYIDTDGVGGTAAVPAPAAAAVAEAVVEDTPATAVVEDTPAPVEDTAVDAPAPVEDAPAVEVPEVEVPEVEVPEVVATTGSANQTASAGDSDKSGGNGSSRNKRSSRGAA